MQLCVNIQYINVFSKFIFILLKLVASFTDLGTEVNTSPYLDHLETQLSSMSIVFVDCVGCFTNIYFGEKIFARDVCRLSGPPRPVCQVSSM